MYKQILKFSSMFLIAVLIMPQVMAHESSEALKQFKENSAQIEALTDKFEEIATNQEKMIKGVDYLRIRNRKKGRALPLNEGQKRIVTYYDVISLVEKEREDFEEDAYNLAVDILRDAGGDPSTLPVPPHLIEEDA